MADEALIKQAVHKYLSQHFQSVEIKRTGRLPGENGGTVLSIVTDEDEYELRLMDEITAARDVGTIVTMLEEALTAQVMRDLVGFPVTVNRNGCVLDNF